MRTIRWKNHEICFESVLQGMIACDSTKPFDFSYALKKCTNYDPLADQEILGVSSVSIAFLEFLFHKAEGPYSPDFEQIAAIICIFFHRNPHLQNLIDLNSADALANMILNKRGRLKFLISDQLELQNIIKWWRKFGLATLSPELVFDAIMSKPTIRDRLDAGDPLLMIRLSDVFPEHIDAINPDKISRELLIEMAGTIRGPPSERRYHQLYQKFVNEDKNIWSVIEAEQKRILPMQMKRNRFLAYLVKKVHGSKCQICSLTGEEREGPVEVHHIIPLSMNGKDSADNMLVTCLFHHKAIHSGRILVSRENELMTIIDSDKKWTIPVNRPKKFE